MDMKELLKTLKEIKDGKEGQLIPYDLIRRGIQPLVERGCLDAVIYLLENTCSEGERDEIDD